ncbi:unnamed protein product [Closterium sp. Naga37s-1]|nr:unnamed protein product [Closterium sp. Naga37s-1]
MVYVDTWDEFAEKAEVLFRADPSKFRYVSKYRHCDGKLVLKATDDRVCIKFRTDQAQDAKKMERLNNLLFTLMARGPDAPAAGLSYPYIPHPHLTMFAPLPCVIAAAAAVPNSCGGVTLFGTPADALSHPYIAHPHLTMFAPLPRVVAAAAVPSAVVESLSLEPQQLASQQQQQQQQQQARRGRGRRQ